MSEPFALEIEWLPADGVTSPELAATWCRLSISVSGQVVTRVEDLTANSTRTGIYCAAYSLAEWVATHWWALRSHVRPAALLDRRGPAPGPLGLSDTNGVASHDMRAAGDGFLWPRMLIVPEGQRTLLAWEADVAPQADVLRFVSTGRTWASPAVVQSALASFVGAVIDRLHDMEVPRTLLEEEWQSILQADAEEVAFCDAAAALGLDPYELDDQAVGSIESLGAIMGPELVAEFAAAVDPRRIREDADWVAQGLKRISHEPGAARGPLAKLRGLEHHDGAAGPPWEIGWDQARAARRILRVSDTDAIGLDGFIVHKHLASADTALQAVASGVSGRIEVVLGLSAGIAGQRFIDGRALWRSLHVRHRPSLLTTAATFEQRVERAFAAELLAPASGIAKLIDNWSGVVLTDEVERVARRFRASPVVVGHQLENQLGLTVAG